VFLVGKSSGASVNNSYFKNFEQLFYDDHQKNAMRGICEDKHGNIYALGLSRLFRYDPQSEQTTALRPTTRGHKDAPFLEGAGHLFQAENEQLWLGNNDSFMLIKIGRKEVSVNEKSIFPYWCVDMALAQNKNFWFGYTILQQLDLATNQIKTHPVSDYFLGNEPSKNTIKKLFCASDSTLWLSGNGVIYHLFRPDDFDKKNIQIYSFETKDKRFLIPNAEIFEIYEDSKHHIWIGTKGAGVVELNEKGEVIQTIDKQQGLCNNLISGILEAADKSIWISTFGGLSRYNPLTKNINNFYISDGLTDNEFNILSSYKAKNSQLYFGGMNGVNTFNPLDFVYLDSLKSTTFMAFTNIKWFSEKQDTFINIPKLGYTNQSIELEANDRLLAIRFALLNLYNASTNIYAYKIKEINDKWIDLLQQNELQLPYLEAGHYTIEIRGKAANSNWSEKHLTLHVTVKQIYYRTWWFVLLCAVALGAIFYAIYQYEVHQIKQRHEIRTTIASNLHDELGTLMTSMAMNIDMTHFAPKDKLPSVLANIERISRNLITLVRDTIWAIDARNDTTDDLLLQMETQAAQLLEPFEITYNFKSTIDEKKSTLKPEIRQQFYFIFKEAINNIAKHSDATLVNIDFRYTKNYIQLHISDNSKEQLVSKKKIQQGGPSGKGLKNMEMRAKSVGATIKINPEKGYELTLIKGRTAHL
jgi:signal transduction histidine kinase